MNKKQIVGALFAPILMYVFIVSGLACSLLSLLLLVIWPFSKNLYRILTSILAWPIFSRFALVLYVVTALVHYIQFLKRYSGKIVWISTEWAEINITQFGDDETYKNLGKEFCLVTLSHRGDLDWVAACIIAIRYGFLHRFRTLPKWSVFYVPGFGQLLWSLECPFLSRNYAKDKGNITKFSKIWETYPFPILVCIFCEGTRFTTEKYERGCQYARNKGLPVLKHHLFPRTKGFATLAEHLKAGTKFKALYDVGFAYPNCPQKYIPSFIHLFLGNEINLYWYMRRIPMDKLPETHDELNSYCIKLYQHKDEAYEYFMKNGVFPGKVQQPPSDTKKWLLWFNMLFWFVTMVIIPVTFVFLILSWSTLLKLLLLGSLGNTMMLLGMLKYAQGTRVVADIAQTTPTQAVPGGKKKKTN